MKLIPVNHREPLIEGEVPKTYRVERDKNGREKLFEVVLEPNDIIHDDDFARDTETYFISGKEEYWGFETICKACGVEFQAYYPSGEPVRNYCPGCGKKL